MIPIIRKSSAQLSRFELSQPLSIKSLDLIPKPHEDFVSKLGRDYPGYDDPQYMNWLKNVRNAPSLVDHVYPISYNRDHLNTWRVIYTSLRELHYKYACKEHLKNLKELEQLNIFSEYEIPNFSKINRYLKNKTGFRLVNIGGMVNPRSFLYGLAFRVFYSTQYIRHGSVPFYSPEPDVVHEVMGHVPLLGDENYANFSERIGKLSLGRTDEEIDIIAKAYFFAVEFGVIQSGVFGAGILGSCNEIELVGSGRGKVKPWNLRKILERDIVLSDYQPEYTNIESIERLEQILEEIIKALK